MVITDTRAKGDSYLRKLSPSLEIGRTR